MSLKKVFIDKQGMIYLVCPSCSESILKPAKEFPMHQKVSISCACGNNYEFQIESRKEFRMETSLRGVYWKIDEPNKINSITIVDLSLAGCCVRASNGHTLQSGERIRVSFKLDNNKRTRIDRDATICWLSGNDIGCQFVNVNAYDPDLGFYIRNFRSPE